jgi:RimJ/RimL family protein N-acetyltransferase
MHTEHLYLRPFTLDDAEAYWPLVSLPEVIRYTGEQPQSSLDDVRKILLDRPLRDYSVHGFGRMACIERSSGRLVGFSGLKYVEDLQDVDIGYRFLPECWGKGYATESARALMQHGAIEHGIDRIIGLVQPDNVASARVLEKLGLTFERQVRPGGVADLKLYATPGTGPNNSFKPKPLRGSA